jgi:hypothetical protein
VSLAGISDFGPDPERGELDEMDLARRAQDVTGSLEVFTRLLAEGVGLDQISDRRHG